jgi:hypothetical protein
LTSLNDLIARKKHAHRDVAVYFDTDAAARIGDLEKQLEDGLTDARLGDGRPQQIRDELDKLREQAADSLVTFRFTALPGPDWAEIIARSFPRPNVPLDSYGYNYHEVARVAGARSGGRLLDDGTVEPVPAEQWAQLWPVLSGHEFEKIAIAVLELNEWDPQQQIESAKKGSPAGTGATSS